MLVNREVEYKRKLPSPFQLCWGCLHRLEMAFMTQESEAKRKPEHRSKETRQLDLPLRTKR